MGWSQIFAGVSLSNAIPPGPDDQEILHSSGSNIHLGNHIVIMDRFCSHITFIDKNSLNLFSFHPYHHSDKKKFYAKCKWSFFFKTIYVFTEFSLKCLKLSLGHTKVLHIYEEHKVCKHIILYLLIFIECLLHSSLCLHFCLPCSCLARGSTLLYRWLCRCWCHSVLLGISTFLSWDSQGWSWTPIHDVDPIEVFGSLLHYEWSE